MNQSLLDPQQASEYLGISEGTLAVWRTNKTYPIPYIKVGNRIRYRQEDLEKWLDDRTKNKICRPQG